MKSGWLLALAIPLLAARPVTPPPAAAPVAVAAPTTVRGGVERWRAGDYAAALGVWRGFAVAGDADALFNMGQAYKLGRGVARDPAVARDYYRRAALKQHLPAQANLGIALFQVGEKAEAMRWLRAAADRGEPRAQYVLAVATRNGDGTPRNIGLAYGYLLRAAASSLPQAQTELGKLEGWLSPAERTAGEAVAASLAAGQGVPAQLANATGPKLVGLPSGELLLKTAPGLVLKPVPLAPTVSPAVAGAPVKLRPVPKPVVTVEAKVIPPVVAKVAPPAVAAAAPPAPPIIIPKPEPAVVEVTSPPPTVAAPSPAPVEVAAAPPPKSAAKLAPAGWRVQLGAFSRKQLADEAWASARSKSKDVLADATPIFDATGPVTKLQIGPYKSRDAARAVCARLADAGRACFVTNG